MKVLDISVKPLYLKFHGIVEKLFCLVSIVLTIAMILMTVSIIFQPFADKMNLFDIGRFRIVLNLKFLEFSGNLVAKGVGESHELSGNLVAIGVGIWTVLGSLVVYLMARMRDVFYGISLFRLTRESLGKFGIAVYFFDYIVVIFFLALSAYLNSTCLCIATLMCELFLLCATTFYIVCSTRRENVDYIIKERSLRKLKKIVLEEENNKHAQDDEHFIRKYFCTSLLTLNLICGADYQYDHDIREIWFGLYLMVYHLKDCIVLKHYELLYYFRSIIKNANNGIIEELMLRFTGLICEAFGWEHSLFTYRFDLNYYTNRYIKDMRPGDKVFDQQIFKTGLVFQLTLLEAIMIERESFGNEWFELLMNIISKLPFNVKKWLYIPVLSYIEYLEEIYALHVYHVNEDTSLFRKLLIMYYYLMPEIKNNEMERIEIFLFTYDCWLSWFENNDQYLYYFTRFYTDMMNLESLSYSSSYVVGNMIMWRKT